MLGLLLILASVLASLAEGAADGKKEGEPQPQLFLFCNLTSSCQVIGVNNRAGCTCSGLCLAPPPPPPLPGAPPAAATCASQPLQVRPLCVVTSCVPSCLAVLQPCGALRLNEHCRTAGGYALATCMAGIETDKRGADFKKPLGPEQTALHEGSIVTQHHACTPHSRVSVSTLLLGCAIGAVAALAVLRWRGQQLRRLGL